MYILIIARGYPSGKYKMNGIFEFDQAKALVESGHKVIYASIDMRSIRNRRKWGYENFIKEGVQIEGINLPYGKFPFLDRIRKWALIKIYKRIKRKYGKPDIIHSHFISSSYATAQVFRNINIPIVMTEHFSGINQHNIKPYYKGLGDYSYSRADKIIAVSRHLANNIEKNFNVDTVVVPNIVDTSSFKYEGLLRSDDYFNFVSTGSLLPNKNMDVLIKAFYEGFKSLPLVRLYIYGEGPERSKLEEMIKDNNLQNRIFLKGLVERKEIAEKMIESQCFVLASKLETFGVAHIEAMAMGLPVVSTRSGGPEDFITKDNGILIEVDKVDELANTMRYVYENIEKYVRKEIAITTKNKFSSRTIANQLIDHYVEVLDTNNKKLF